MFLNLLYFSFVSLNNIFKISNIDPNLPLYVHPKPILSSLFLPFSILR